MSLKSNKSFSNKFRTNYYNEIKLATLIIEEKVKQGENITRDEINELLSIISENLDKIQQLNDDAEID